MGLRVVSSARKVIDLFWGAMRASTEAPLDSTTAPAVPTYDTAVNIPFRAGIQTGAGTLANIWWAIVVVPEDYVDTANLFLRVDGLYALTGDAVLVAATIDAEVFPYDSVNGDFSNTDICATAAQALATAFATEEFTLTGTSLTRGIPLLIRFTSSIQITSAGGAGTGRNSFAFPRLEYDYMG